MKNITKYHYGLFAHICSSLAWFNLEILSTQKVFWGLTFIFYFTISTKIGCPSGLAFIYEILSTLLSILKRTLYSGLPKGATVKLSFFFCFQTVTTPPPIRLIDNNLDDDVQLQEGLVEVQFAGEWGLICINNEHYVYLISTICRQLGYSGGATTGARINVNGRRVWLQGGRVDCPYDATRIDQCSFDEIGYGSCNYLNESLQIQCEGDIIVNLKYFRTLKTVFVDNNNNYK